MCYKIGGTWPSRACNDHEEIAGKFVVSTNIKPVSRHTLTIYTYIGTLKPVGVPRLALWFAIAMGPKRSTEVLPLEAYF